MLAQKRDSIGTDSNQPGAPGNPPATVDEAEIFPPPVGPRYFGTGSYRTGGSNAEGNYGLGEVNPRGGYGSFTDAGGPGATTLLGEEEKQEEQGSPRTAEKPLPKP
jgi:hypothetical protein